MKKISILLAISLSFVFVAGSFAGEVKSLRKTVEVLNPSIVIKATSFPDTEPGESKLLPRAYDTAPPQISHTMADTKITLKKNTCLDCHSKKNAKKTDSPEMAESHFKDAMGKQLKTYYKGRYYCTQCHVAQTGAKPVVKNTFKGTKFVRKYKD